MCMDVCVQMGLSTERDIWSLTNTRGLKSLEREQNMPYGGINEPLTVLGFYVLSKA